MIIFIDGFDCDHVTCVTRCVHLLELLYVLLILFIIVEC